MASSAKRRAVGMGENPADSEDNSSDEGLEDDCDSGEKDSGSEEEINEEVIVDFEAHTITHNDYNGVKKLLQQLFLKANVNTSELTDLLIQQNHIGSVIRQAEVPEDSDDEGDPADEVFGFISMLNLTERKDLILGQCEKSCPHSVADDLEKVLNDTSKPVGLLLSERFINVPPQIALPLHKQLQSPCPSTSTTVESLSNPTTPQIALPLHKQLQSPCPSTSSYNESSGLTLPPQIAPCPPNSYSESLSNPNPHRSPSHPAPPQAATQATMKFHYSVQDETDSVLSGRWSFDDVPMKPQRTVMLIPADRMSAIMDKLKEYLTV
ncbi:unnamed protein product [Coregonus sp. 'balchen']|nr:unnamed protein product [Coregonus sp. 'balchen']